MRRSPWWSPVGSIGRRAAFALAAAAAVAALPGQQRIVPLGDSITESRSPCSSYRYYLWKLLEANQLCADFVGVRGGVASGLPKQADFDQDHDGFSGAMAVEVDLGMQLLPELVPTADIALVHLGANDILRPPTLGGTVDLVAAEDALVSIVGQLRTRNAAVKVAIAQLMPINDVAANAHVAQWNSVHLPNVLQRTQQAGSPVVLVDQNTAFQFATDYRDRVHPSDAGERRLAANWFAALVANGWLPTQVACAATLAPGCAAGTPTGPPRLESTLPRPNGAVVFTVSNLPAGTLAVAGVLGLAIAPAPLQLLACNLYPTPDVVVPWPIDVAVGTASFAVPLPASLVVPGQQFYVQAVTMGQDPSATPTSNGLQLLVGW